MSMIFGWPLPPPGAETLQTGTIKRQRSGQLAESEIMTILIHFHQSHYRDFKAYYLQHVSATCGPSFQSW